MSLNEIQEAHIAFTKTAHNLEQRLTTATRNTQVHLQTCERNLIQLQGIIPLQQITIDAPDFIHERRTPTQPGRLTQELFRQIYHSLPTSQQEALKLVPAYQLEGALYNTEHN